MSIIERVEGLTLEAYIRLYDEEGPFELIEGERIPVYPNVAGHNLITKRVFLALYDYGERQNLGEVFSEMPFVLADDSNWVEGSRVPDVMFYWAERLVSYRETTPDWAEKPYVLIPDLVVEVVSPTDRYSKLNRKVDVYLADGVPLIWVVDPQRRTVMVHHGNEYIVLAEDATLSGGDVLPGFEMAVAAIFVS